MDRERDQESLLRGIICGDLDERDPEVQAALAATPGLRTQLVALRAAVADLTALRTEADAIEEQAPVAATDSDRQRLASFVASRRRRLAVPARAGWLLAAAAVLVAVAWWWQPARPRQDTALGGAGQIALRRDGEGLRVLIREQLPPGEGYHLRLELDGDAALTATTDSADWLLPLAWNQALAAATSARLVVQCGDRRGLASVLRVQVK